MRIAWLALAASACGSAAHPARRPPATTPYLMLFEQGRTFSLPATQTSASGDPARTTARCTVTEVKQIGDANVARLACAPPHQGLLIVGTWVATTAGLYHPYLPVDEPDELTLLGEDDLLIAAIPKQRDHNHVTEGTEESTEAFDLAGSWCVRHTTSAGNDRRRFALCFDGQTLTGGSDLVGVGTDWQRVELGTAPKDDDDDD